MKRDASRSRMAAGWVGVQLEFPVPGCESTGCKVSSLLSTPAKKAAWRAIAVANVCRTTATQPQRQIDIRVVWPVPPRPRTWCISWPTYVARKRAALTDTGKICCHTPPTFVHGCCTAKSNSWTVHAPRACGHTQSISGHMITQGSSSSRTLH